MEAGSKLHSAIGASPAFVETARHVLLFFNGSAVTPAVCPARVCDSVHAILCNSEAVPLNWHKYRPWRPHNEVHACCSSPKPASQRSAKEAQAGSKKRPAEDDEAVLQKVTAARVTAALPSDCPLFHPHLHVHHTDELAASSQ